MRIIRCNNNKREPAHVRFSCIFYLLCVKRLYGGASLWPFLSLFFFSSVRASLSFSSLPVFLLAEENPQFAHSSGHRIILRSTNGPHFFKLFAQFKFLRRSFAGHFALLRKFTLSRRAWFLCLTVSEGCSSHLVITPGCIFNWADRNSLLDKLTLFSYEQLLLGYIMRASKRYLVADRKKNLY